jgi:hypothetical protein
MGKDQTVKVTLIDMRKFPQFRADKREFYVEKVVGSVEPRPGTFIDEVTCKDYTMFPGKWTVTIRACCENDFKKYFPNG